MPQFVVRAARPADLDAIAALTVAVYRDGGFAKGDYARTLADVRDRAEHTDLIVAVDEAERVIGSVALVLHGGPYAEVSTGEQDAEFRMLVVDMAQRSSGVGTALIEECLGRARTAGKSRMVLCTALEMTAAHRRYAAMGFRRLPDLDWSPMPEVSLLGYVLDLGADQS